MFFVPDERLVWIFWQFTYGYVTDALLPEPGESVWSGKQFGHIIQLIQIRFPLVKTTCNIAQELAAIAQKEQAVLDAAAHQRRLQEIQLGTANTNVALAQLKINAAQKEAIANDALASFYSATTPGQLTTTTVTSAGGPGDAGYTPHPVVAPPHPALAPAASNTSGHGGVGGGAKPTVAATTVAAEPSLTSESQDGISAIATTSQPHKPAAVTEVPPAKKQCSALFVFSILMLVFAVIVLDWSRSGLLRSLARTHLPASTYAQISTVVEHVRDFVVTNWNSFEAAGAVDL